MSIERVFPSLADPLKLVEEELQSQVGPMVERGGGGNGRNEYFDRVIRHIFLKPGKLLRPALVLLSARLARGGETGRRAPAAARPLVRLAAAAELIHSASLVHDDILDEEEVRRGQEALHHKYGNHIAVLVGDMLYAQAFALLNAIRLPDRERQGRIIRLFCAAAQRMCLGEIASQRIAGQGLQPSLEEYLQILENKTAALMAACCQGGAIAGGGDAAACRSLAEFGLSFGMAFQLVDDHEDRDAPLSAGFDGLALAGRYARRARGSLARLAESPARDSLAGICERVLRKARPG